MAYEQDPGWRYLKQPVDEALADQAKRFESKTHCWIPDAEEGFIPAEIKARDAQKVTVLTARGEEKTLAKDDTQEMNPPKYDKLEDMSNLTFLNEASVLDNLRQRYYVMMIYTYSGLFCVVINPYKRLPIYTESVVKMYKGKRRNEMPPHLFAVADEAYRNMMEDKENQSMLITGESGAGKTENTKKVISYFALVGASSSKEPKKKGGSLEEQIVQTNPVLEAFGNAKTVRNNNSSRFGKFIRIHFNAAGKLAGGDIEHYLLEKSRVIKQAPGERCYHIFYQIMSGHIKGLKESLCVDKEITSFHVISQAELTIDGVDDGEEMALTDEAFDIMGFEQVEKDNMFKLCGAIMHMGEMKFKQKPREEQAEADGTEEAELACKLFSVSPEEFVKALLKPRVKVGTEWVNKGQNLEQVGWAVGALSKAVYARMFTWLIKRCNKTLDAHALKREYFIGVLDIAGFEIFDFNSFEQLWINFVNEKLQQFFNHHMFVLEQEEYQREGIKWEFIDFGLDLQACIELIEKPLGIISMLDEECIVPKATDLTFVQKLNDQHLGKHPNLQKPKPPKGKQAEAHFACVHYAGTVRYNVKSWLEKNKDPLNDTVVSVYKTSVDNQLLKDIWADYQTQEDIAKLAPGAAAGKKKGKSASFQTVSLMYRESLSNLMNMLRTTHPHFIRCIIPNEQKKSGVIEAGLVLNQLTCNGVLEGIRICRKGFPNRMVYHDFRHRYAILAANEAAESDAKKASEKMMKRLESEKQISEEQYRCGHTKVFFKAGVLAHMEELRDAALSMIIAKFQCACRAFLAQCEYKRRLDRMGAYLVIQRNVKAWCVVRSWGWYHLYKQVKPLLKGDQQKEEMEELQKKVKMLEESLGVEITKRTRAEKENTTLTAVNEEITASLDKETSARKGLQKDNEELNDKVSDLEQSNHQLTTTKKKLESLNDSLRQNNDDLDVSLKKSMAEGQVKDQQIRSLHDEITQQDSLIAKQNQDKKVQETVNRELSDNLNQEVIKTERLENLRNKLETTLDELERNFDLEKKSRGDLDRAKKKVESELRAAHEKIDELRLQKNDLENYLKKKEAEVGALKNRMDDDQNMVAKLQLHIRELQQRIGDLEEEIENEHRGRSRAEKMKGDLQEELDQVSMRLEEANGALTTQLHLNKQRNAEVSRLYHELEARNINHETHINELCNLQWTTLSNFRDLSTKAGLLESEVGQLLAQIKTQKDQKPRRIFRADTGADGVARSASYISHLERYEPTTDDEDMEIHAPPPVSIPRHRYHVGIPAYSTGVNRSASAMGYGGYGIGGLNRSSSGLSGYGVGGGFSSLNVDRMAERYASIIGGDSGDEL